MLLIVFTLSFAFGLSQTPMIYAYKTMTCQDYYKDQEAASVGGHSLVRGGDRCEVKDVETRSTQVINISMFVMLDHLWKYRLVLFAFQ